MKARHLIEALRVGRTPQEVDEIMSIIAHAPGERSNQRLEPYGLQLVDEPDEVMREFGVPGYVGDDGYARVSSRLPFSMMRQVVSHELVHVDQMRRAAETGDADKMYASGHPDDMTRQTWDVKKGLNNPHEVAAMARTSVDRAAERRSSRGRYLDQIKRGGVDDPFVAHMLEPESKKRYLKNAYAYAQDVLPEGLVEALIQPD